MESLDGHHCQYGTGNPQLKRRRTLRHEKFLDWFWYSLIWTHWLQSDSIIADIRDAVNLSWPIYVFFQSQHKPSFHPRKGFLGTSPCFILGQKFLRTKKFWTEKVSSNREKVKLITCVAGIEIINTSSEGAKSGFILGEFEVLQIKKPSQFIADGIIAAGIVVTSFHQSRQHHSWNKAISEKRGNKVPQNRGNVEYFSALVHSFASYVVAHSQLYLYNCHYLIGTLRLPWISHCRIPCD